MNVRTDPEIAAMRRVVGVLDRMDLPHKTRIRVLAYLADRYRQEAVERSMASVHEVDEPESSVMMNGLRKI